MNTVTTATHTPGPWLLGQVGHSNVVHYDGDDVLPVASVPYEPNRRLIAAAPELLQLLREARELLNDQDTDLNLIDWLQATEAVIAKAEGRS